MFFGELLVFSSFFLLATGLLFLGGEEARDASEVPQKYGFNPGTEVLLFQPLQIGDRLRGGEKCGNAIFSSLPSKTALPL
jgi:hypothetical protein